MANIQSKREYAGKAAKECYVACLRALSESGYKTVKQRDYAWFVMSSQVIDGQSLTCNILVSPVEPISVSLTMTAKNLSEEQLNHQSDELLGAVERIVGLTSPAV